MAAAVQTDPAPAATSSDDADLVHIVCCDPNKVAMCGFAEIVRQVPWGCYGPRDCVVCADLDRVGCPRCHR